VAPRIVSTLGVNTPANVPKRAAFDPAAEGATGTSPISAPTPPEVNAGTAIQGARDGTRVAADAEGRQEKLKAAARTGRPLEPGEPGSGCRQRPSRRRHTPWNPTYLFRSSSFQYFRAAAATPTARPVFVIG
jgi:hypothetical protein